MGKYKTPAGCYPLHDLQEEMSKNMNSKMECLGSDRNVAVRSSVHRIMLLTVNHYRKIPTLEA